MEGIKKKLNNLKLQLEDAQENETVLKKGKKELEDEVDELKNEVESFKRQIKLKDDEFETTDERLQEATKSLADVQERLEEAVRDVKKYESTQEQDIEMKEGLTVKARDDKEKIELQQNQIEEMERKIKILEGDLEASEDACEEYKKKVTELEFCSTTLTNDFKAKETSETNLSEQNDQMSDKIKVITEQLKEQESRGDDLERDISTLKLRYTELEGDLETAEDKYAAAKKELESMMEELGDIC